MNSANLTHQIGLIGLLTWRDHSIKRVIGQYSEPESTLMVNMLHGQQLTLSPELDHLVKVMGMQHVMVASGSNVSLLLMPCLWLMRFFGPLQSVGLWLTLVVIWGYTVMAGGEPPTLRAAVMATYKIATIGCHRQYGAAVALIFAISVMLLFNRAYFTSVSFHLSILATAAIIWLLPLLTRPGFLSAVAVGDVSPATTSFSFFSSPSFLSNIKNQLREAWWLSVAVQLVVGPYTLAVFGEISWLSVFANSLLSWLIPLITTSVLVYSLLLWIPTNSWLLIGLTQWWHGWLWLITDLFLQGLKIGVFFSGAVLKFKLSWWLVAVWWLGLIFWVMKGHLKQQSNYDSRFSSR